MVGEHSGDILAADLMQAWLKKFPNSEFIGIAGPNMQALGATSLFPMERLAIMGFFEVLKHVPGLFLLRYQLIKYFSKHKPDIFIGVDAPDFNLGLELILRRKGVPVVHYVSPSVWAWREYRIKKINKAIDLMLCLLPFEKNYYAQKTIAAEFVGHPLASQIPMVSDKLQARKTLKIATDKPVITLLPGSRMGEVKRHRELFF